jgi:hypothetical protein
LNVAVVVTDNVVKSRENAALVLETRLLGGGKFHPTEPTSADLSEPEPAEQAATAVVRPR